MFEKFNERTKRLNWLDVGLIKWSMFFFTIIIVKIFPQLLNISIPVLLILTIVCVAKPVYVFWLKK